MIMSVFGIDLMRAPTVLTRDTRYRMNTGNSGERALLDGVNRLDNDALVEVHGAYYRPLFRYIYSRIGDREAAEDLTSEVFTRLLDAIRDGRGPKTTLRGWLYGVANNVATDQLRAKYRAQEDELDPAMPAATGDPIAAAEKSLAHVELNGALEDLTEDQRHIIALRFGSELPIKDVARIVGKSEGAVKQLQSRAVARLARALGTLGEGAPS